MTISQRVSKLLCVSLFGICTHSFARAQDAPDIGIQPYKTYSNTDIDHIDLANGNVFGSIPLISYSQLGHLEPLTFSLNFNSNPWYQQQECDSYSQECLVYFINYGGSNTTGSYVGDLSGVQLISNLQGTRLQVNSGITSWWTCTEVTPCDVEVASRTFSITDNTGASHALLFDPNNPSWLHAADGTGYSFFAQNAEDPWDSANWFVNVTGTIYQPNGNILQSSDVSGAASVRDLNGNSISYAPVVYTSGMPSGANFTDSISRVIPDPNWSEIGAPLSSCPDLGDPNQALVGATQWNAPGQNGSTETYIFCWTNIVAQTEFYNNGNCDTWMSTWDPSNADDTQFNPGTLGQPGGYSQSFCDSLGFAYGIQSVVLPNGTYWGFLYDAGAPYDCVDGDCLYTESYATVNKIFLPTGGSISYTYSNRPGPARVVRSRTITDIAGNTEEKMYSYDSSGGFLSTTETVNGNDVVHVFNARSIDPAQDSGFAPAPGYETKAKYFQGNYANGTLLKEVDTVYQGLNADSNVVPITITTSIPSGTISVESRSYISQGAEVESYGCAFYPVDLEDGGCEANLIGANYPNTSTPMGEQIIYMNQVGTDTMQASGSEKTMITVPEWQLDSNFADTNQLTAIGTQQVLDGNGDQVSMTTFGYDTNGNQTSVSKWLNASASQVVTRVTYNAHGMPTDFTDANQNISHVNSFQCAGLYPQSLTVAYVSTSTLPETTTVTRDCNTGSPLSSSDANGIVASYTYNDPLGRITKFAKSIGTPDESWQLYSYPSMNETIVSKDQNVKGDGLLRTTIIGDGIGHIIQTQDPDGAIVLKHYNSVGLLDWMTNPYFTTSDATFGRTFYNYDGLARQTLVTNPDGSTIQTCYDGLQTTGQTICKSNQTPFSGVTWVDSVDEVGNSKQSVSNGIGMLLAVVEASPSDLQSGMETDYGYDALGNLWSVNQHGASSDTPRTRSFSYDALSRLITSSNPETGQTCYGIWSGANCINGYDGNGNLQYKTDARGVQTHYTYDALNRLTGKYYSNDPSSTVNTCYQYDTVTGTTSGANPIGRMTAEWTQSESAGTCPSAVPSTGALTAELVTAYDALGRVKHSQQCVLGNCAAGGVPFSLTQGYDLAGNTVNWTDGLNQILFTLHYDTAGRLQTLTSSWSDVLHPSTLFSSQSGTACGSSVQGYNAAGALQNWTLGNNLNVARCYDSRLRVTSETATVP